MDITNRNVNFYLGFYDQKTNTGANKYFARIIDALISQDINVIIYSYHAKFLWVRNRYLRKIVIAIDFFFRTLFVKGSICTDIIQAFSFNRYSLFLFDVREVSGCNRHNKLVFFMKKIWLKVPTNIITISKFTKSQLLTHYGIKNVNIVYPICVDEVREKNTRNKDIDFLFVGQFDARKMQVYFLHVLEYFVEEAKVIFVGIDGGNLKEFQEVFNKFRNNNVYIELVINAENDELNDLYSRSKGLVLISTYEGFGMPIVEAASRGLNIITSDMGVLSDFDFSISLITEHNAKLAALQLSTAMKLYIDGISEKNICAGETELEKFSKKSVVSQFIYSVF